MRKLHIILLLVLFFLLLVVTTNASAITSGGVIISEVQLGAPEYARHEFIEIYNNSDVDVEITNWCLNYQSSSLSESELTCFSSESENIHIYLPARTSAFSISNELALFDPLIESDNSFAAKLSGTAGYIRLLDSLDQEIDRIGWGLLGNENNLAATAPAGKVLSRKLGEDGLMQDTGLSSDDFVIKEPKVIYLAGQLYDLIDVCSNIIGIQIEIPGGYELDLTGVCIVKPIDICPNLEGIQVKMPANYGLDEFHDCQIDLCLNIDDLQTMIPDGLVQDSNGNCGELDVCLNIEMAQAVVPDGMIIGSSGDCINKALKLIITELLPNAISTDDGNEYIEIYNPNQSIVDLADYRIYIVSNYLKWYDFPPEAKIAPFGYLVFSDDQLGFQLVNTTSSVQLATINEVIDETLVYSEPKEGESWALINDVWQYTNQVTLGYANLVSVIPDTGIVLSASTEIAICAEGYYRHPETNRCRKIVSTESVLVPCRDGQYRSEETGRCRNIVSDVVAYVPCAEGEERNSTTNRCRKVVSDIAISLEPCQSGQERNPETNRCRNIVADIIPAASYAPEKVVDSSNSLVYVWALSFIAFLAASYGIWEWRQEIVKLFKKRS